MADAALTDGVPFPLDRRGVSVPLGGAVCVVAGETLATWALVPITDGGVWLVGLLAVALSVIGGGRVWWGVGLGELLVGTVFGSFSTGVAVGIAASVAVLVCDRLWNPPSRRTPRWAVHYLGVAVLAVAALGATLGTLAELFGHATFSVRFASMVRATLPSTLAGLPVVWLLAGRVATTENRSLRTRTRRGRALIAAIVLFWAGTVYAASLVFRTFGLVPPVLLGRRLAPPVRAGYELLDGGRYAIVLFGLVALLAIAYVERGGRRDDDPIRKTE